MAIFAYNKYSSISDSNKKDEKERLILRQLWNSICKYLVYGYCFKAVSQISHCFRIDDLEILSISDLFEVIGEMDCPLKLLVIKNNQMWLRISKNCLQHRDISFEIHSSIILPTKQVMDEKDIC